MNHRLAHKIAIYYDKLYALWLHRRVASTASNIVAFVFITGIIIFLLSLIKVVESSTINKFLGIEMAFNVLLIIEVFGLIFALPGSVSESVGKQFEIISLILLRNSFKDFGHLPEHLDWGANGLTQMLPMASDAFGALLLFLITGLFYKAQAHTKITATEEEQLNFVNVKKVIALCILILFLYFGIKDMIDFVWFKRYISSFNSFYTVLVFTDILILIYSLRFSSKYIHLFRYSSYAFATILLRMSLSAPAFYNILLCLSAGFFVLAVTYVYNYLNKKNTLNKSTNEIFNRI